MLNAADTKFLSDFYSVAFQGENEKRKGISTFFSVVSRSYCYCHEIHSDSARL